MTARCRITANSPGTARQGPYIKLVGLEACPGSDPAGTLLNKSPQANKNYVSYLQKTKVAILNISPLFHSQACSYCCGKFIIQIPINVRRLILYVELYLEQAYS